MDASAAPSRFALLPILVLLTLGVASAPASAAWHTTSLLALSGPHADAGVGSTVRTADVNGDGRGDLLVTQTEQGVGYGKVLVFLGADPPHTTPDITLVSPEENDSYGVDVASAGDINGDGYDDVIVGAWLSGLDGFNAGRAYVYFGGPSMDATPDLVLHGVPGQLYGSRVSSAGDVNGDGYDDFLVAAWSTPLGGRVDLYLGGPSPATVPVFQYYGENGNDVFGNSIAPAGDLNHDGRGDFIIGAQDNDAGGTDAGRAYVYMHYDGPLETGQPDLTLTGVAAGDEFGVAVAGAGDVNHDGYDDVIVGAWQYLSGGPGRAYVFFGGSSPDATPDLVLTGQAPGERFGGRVAGAGDLSGDGIADVVVGANNHDAFAGRVYVYLGSPAMDAIADATVDGEAGSGLGSSVTGALDFDGNGRRDFAAGAPLATPNGSHSGKAFVYSLAAVSACTLLDDWLTDTADGALAIRNISFGPAGAHFASGNSAIDYSPSLIPAQGTIEMNLKWDGVVGALILDTRGVGGRQPGDAIMSMKPDGHLFFTIDPIGGRNPCCIPGVTSTTVFNATDYHCVSASYGSGGLRLYVDGVLEDANPTVTASLIRSTVSLGDFLDATPQSWLGVIRRIRTSCTQNDVELPGEMGCGPPCTLPPGMTAWWPADGNGSDVVGGRSWTLHGDASFGPGFVSQALRLDGNGDWAATAATGLNLGTADFGVDLWVDFAATGPVEVIMEKYIETFDLNRTGWGVALTTPSHLHVYGPVPTVVPSIVDADIPAVVPGTWHHLAVTRSGDLFSLYWDCALVGTNSWPGLNLSTTSSLKVGHRGDPADTPGSLDTREFYLDGAVDEVEMFVGRALSAAEIQAVCAAGSAGRCKRELVAVDEPPGRGGALEALRIAPNPVAGGTEIRFRLARAGRAALRIYDLSGRLVRALDAGGTLAPGDHQIEWNGRGEGGERLPGGVYWCRLAVEGRTLTKSLILVR